MKYRVLNSALLLFFLQVFLSGCASAEGQPGGESVAESVQEAETADGQAALDETTDGNQEETFLETERPQLVLEEFLLPDGQLDLDSLQEWNEECYGWLDIPDSQLSFPIMQSKEDLGYYLNHNFFREEDENGCVYTEVYNSLGFSDPNTVIYGRNRESVFAGLHQYQDRDFYESHRELLIYLENQVLHYRIFAAYPFDDRHLVLSYDLWDKNVFKGYLADVFSIREMGAFIDTSMNVTSGDRIVTLSTGVTGEDEKRFLVQAVLMAE